MLRDEIKISIIICVILIGITILMVYLYNTGEESHYTKIKGTITDVKIEGVTCTYIGNNLWSVRGTEIDTIEGEFGGTYEYRHSVSKLSVIMTFTIDPEYKVRQEVMMVFSEGKLIRIERV